MVCHDITEILLKLVLNTNQSIKTKFGIQFRQYAVKPF